MNPRTRAFSTVAASFAAMLALAATAAEADARVDAFQSVCIEDRQDYDALTVTVIKAGWDEAVPGDHQELDALLQAAADSLAEEEAEDYLTGYKLAAFKKPLDQRMVYLLLTRIDSEYIDLVSCSLYDLDGDQPINPFLISEWLGQVPGERINQPGVISAQTWGSPEKLPGTWDVYSAFLPEGGAASALTGFSGTLLKITSVDPKDE